MATIDASRPLLSRMAYDSGYYLAYGIVFPAAFLIHVIPGARRISSGVIDGTQAARNYLDHLREQKTAPAPNLGVFTEEEPAPVLS